MKNSKNMQENGYCMTQNPKCSEYLLYMRKNKNILDKQYNNNKFIIINWSIYIIKVLTAKYAVFLKLPISSQCL